MFHQGIHTSRNAGYSLLSGSILMFSTMVLHPTHLHEGYVVINIVSHSLAILSLPFLLLGFWGLSKVVSKANFLSNLGLSFILFGLVAGMLAAAINGIAATLFYGSQSPENEVAKVVLTYSFALNNAVSYVLIGALLSSILLFSLAIVRTHAVPVWGGYFGIVAVISALVFSFSTNVMHVGSFRILVFALVSWIVLMAIFMIRQEGDR